MVQSIRIGTRGSPLAMYQAVLLQAKLKELYPLISSEIIKIKTKGDMIRRGGIASIGRGIFTREIEEALLAKEIDVAVHSAKDLESELPPGLEIGAALEREDPRDCLLSRERLKFSDLKSGSQIGTSSLRRKSQLLKMRPDLQILELRGNVGTRIDKLQAGQFDAIIMAYAGIKRLALTDHVSDIFKTEELLPQAGQGTIAVEMRSDSEDIRQLVQPLNHSATFSALTAERHFLRVIHGGCQIPVGVMAETNENKLAVVAAVFSLDGSKEVRRNVAGPIDRADLLGAQLADSILSGGGKAILDEVRTALES